MNSTIENFGYPETLIYEASSWVVLLRPAQATLGALVLACKEPCTALSDLSGAALAEMPQLMRGCEQMLGTAFTFDKINYLMLMMVDPHVHYHVLPRYAQPKQVAATELQALKFEDAGWPALPRLDLPTATTSEQNAALVKLLKAHWQS